MRGFSPPATRGPGQAVLRGRCGPQMDNALSEDQSASLADGTSASVSALAGDAKTQVEELRMRPAECLPSTESSDDLRSSA